MRVGDATDGSFAVIDLVAHLYRGSTDDRRALAAIWTRYSDATLDERKSRGFEIVRMHHATLTRMFRDDPNGDYLDIDDLRMTWEEFVDALRDATGASQEAEASHDAKSYEALERPVMRRNESFNKLAVDLEALVLSQSSPRASAENTPEGSTRGIERISSTGMLLGIGCSSREPSVRGGGAFFSEKSKLSASELQEKLQNAS